MPTVNENGTRLRHGTIQNHAPAARHWGEEGKAIVLNQPLVYVVEDDPEMRNSLAIMLRSAGLQTEVYESVEAFLENSRPQDRAPNCLVLDYRLPGLSGPGLQERLRDENRSLPIIYLTAYADIPMTVQAMKRGAFDVLEKPVHRQLLLERIREALDYSVTSQTEKLKRKATNERIASLSSREQEVMDLLAEGKSTKEIAADLDIGLQTVAKHRASVLEKMDVASVVELVRLLAEK